MAKDRLKLLLFFYIINIILDTSYAKEDSFPDNLLYTGKPCEQIVHLHTESKETRDFLTVYGDYTKNDAELAFDCKVEAILPVESGSNAVAIECKIIEVKSLGDPNGCPIIIEVNRGAKKVCAHTEELRGRFSSSGSKVELRVISRLKARNRFKGGVPTFECKMRIDEEANAIPYPPEATVDITEVTGFYWAETCNEEIVLDKESDVKTIEAAVKLFEGLSYFDCTKVIRVPENFNLVVRCSKFRFVDYDYNHECIAFAQIDNGQKVCYPERISGTFKPNGGKVILRLHSKALNGLRYVVGKPLFDCRLTIETSSTVQGFIWMYSSTGSTSSLYRSLRIEDLPKENRKYYDIPKMTKRDFQKAVVSRATPVEGLSACGGHINLEKWGYTFTLEGETVSNPSTVVNYDCDWTFYLPRKVHINSKINALVIKCDKMPISDPSNEKCSASYTVNNELSYCNDDPHSNLDGFYEFDDSNVVLRARSAHNNIFDNKKPIFNCTVVAISLIDNHLSAPPRWQNSNTGSSKSKRKETIAVSSDGRRPTYVLGESRPNDGPVAINDQFLLKVQPSANPHLQTFVVLRCNRLNTIKVSDKRCQAYYLVNDKHKVCEGDELNGIFQPFDNFDGNCLVKISIKTEGDVSFIGDDTPYYQCKAFIHDMTPWSQIISGTRLSSIHSIGDYIAGNRRSRNKPSVCGIDPSIVVSPAGSATEASGPVAHEVTSDEPKTVNKTHEEEKISDAPGVATHKPKIVNVKTVTSEDENVSESADETETSSDSIFETTHSSAEVETPETRSGAKPVKSVSELPKSGPVPELAIHDSDKANLKSSEDDSSDRRRKRETDQSEENGNKEVTNEKPGAALTSTYDNIYEKRSSILGSYPDIDSVPIGKLSRIRISDLGDPRYNVKAIGDLKIGQLGAIAELGKLGHLGGLKFGQLRKLDIFPQLSYKRFGTIGEIQIDQLSANSKDGKLGLFGRLSLYQLSRLARVKFLRRLTIGLVANVLPININLRNKVSEVLQNAEFRSRRSTHVIKREKAHYAFQLPEINQVYDLINLNNVLYEALVNLSETKILKDFHLSNNPVGKGFKIDESFDGMKKAADNIQLTKDELLKNAEQKLEKILKSLKVESNEVDDDLVDLGDLCIEQLYNGAQILVSVAQNILKALSGGSANPLLTRLHHIEVWNVNRLLAGVLGGKYAILGLSIEPTLEAIVKTLGGSLKDLRKDSPNVTFSNDGALHLIVKLLGKPHERMCPKNATNSEQESHSREKRDANYDYETEATFPPDDYDEGVLKLETPDEISATCEVIKDSEHYKDIAEGRDGGTLTLAKLYEVSNILVNKLNADNKIKELTQLDRSLQWRIARLSIGFISGILKQFDDDLGPELYKIADSVVKGFDVVLPTSSQSLAMGISGTMDSTLISLGVSVSQLLSVAQGKSVNQTIGPLAALLKLDPNPNGITKPILQALNSLINNAVNLGPFVLKKLLDSLLHNIKPVFYATQSLSPTLAPNDLVTFIKVYSGALALFAKITHSNDLKILSLLLALNNTLAIGLLEKIAFTEVYVGTPHYNLKPFHTVIYGHVSSVNLNFTKLSTSLGSIAPILIASDAKGYSDNQSHVWKGPKIDEIDPADLVQLCSAICVQLEAVVSQTSNLLIAGKLNIAQVYGLVASIFGQLAGAALTISQSLVNFEDRGSNISYSNKVLSEINFVAELSKMLSKVNKDLGLAEKLKVDTVSSVRSNLNVESDAKIFEQMEAAFNSIANANKGMFAEVGLTAVSLAFSVGITVDSIANVFYDFGHSKAKTYKNQLISGTIGAIQNQLGSAPTDHKYFSLGTLEEEETLSEKIAAKKRNIILNHDKIQMPINKHGIVVVATDNGTSDIGQFYDEEDLDQEIKDMIMNQVSHVLLQKEIQRQLLAANKGNKIYPITIEVETPIYGIRKKINVTLSSLANDYLVSDQLFSKYLGPLTDDYNVGHDASGECAPQGLQTCIEWRESAALKLQSDPRVFLPTCLPDGSFSRLQCDDNAGLCWCVNGSGQQIAGTVSKLTKPDCFNLPAHNSDANNTNSDTIDNEIDIRSKYLVGPSLEQKDRSAQNQFEESNHYIKSECFREQRHKELLNQRRVASALGVFIPDCLEDGSYSPVQCDKRTEFCWCVTKSGKEILNTAKIGEKPNNCEELQETHSRNSNKQLTSSWTYLWQIVRKWQQLSHSRVRSERRSDPLYKYKPNGTLVRLPKSSGFDNSVMFCAEEPAGPGLPSPYEVWRNVMVAENPTFNKTEYELSPRELNKLALIRLSLRDRQTIQVPLVSVIEVFPAAQDLYVKLNGNIDKLEEVLRAMDVDWQLLLATIKNNFKPNSGSTRPPGVLGSGHMSMVSAQKMCFCYMTPNTGSVINASAFEKSSSRNAGFGSFDILNSARKQFDFGINSSSLNKTLQSDGDDEEKLLKMNADEYSGILQAEKKPEGKGQLRGDSGRIMHAVTQAITDLNPIRLLIKVDLDPLLNIQGINLFEVKAPLSFFSLTFFDRMSAKTQMDKVQLGKELGTDLTSKGDEAMVSIGRMLKTGHKHKLKLGDYISFLGIDLSAPMNKYDDYMIETVRRPIELADTLLNDGFQKTMKKIQEYVNENGGPMNAAMKLVGNVTGKDLVGSTQQAINAVTSFNVEKQAQHLNNQMKEFAETINKKTKKWINQQFGDNAPIHKIRAQVSQLINTVIKFISSIANGNQFQVFIEMVGQTIGPTGRSLLYIVYASTSTMFNQVFGPLLLIPKIMSNDAELMDKFLALPPVIIQMSGGMFKPVMMVVEPLLRLVRFLSTGEYTKSLSAGLDIAASFGINIWGGAYKIKKQSDGKSKGRDKKNDQHQSKPHESKSEPKIEKKRKRDKRYTKKIDESISATDLRNLTLDQKIADAYQGGPPPGGYRLGVQNDGRTDLSDDFISRILLSPDFLLKAGGNVFIPFSSVLAPSLRSLNIIFFGTGDLVKRVSEVPEIIRGVGFVGPLADVIQASIPFIKLEQSYQKGTLTGTDIAIQTPALVKELTTGTLYNVYKDPKNLLKAMFSWLEGDGGILAMLRMQANGQSPITSPGATDQYKIEASFVTDSIGEFFGGWFLTYVQALGPIGSTISALFNGILGNIIDPVKFLDSEPNIRTQPLKNFIKTFDDMPKMYKISADRKMFLISILGGQDPDPLKECGFDIDKLVKSGIDPAYLLTSGTKLMKPEARKSLEDQSRLEEVGINIKLLPKVDLDVRQLLDSGLLDANQDKLREMGIDVFTILSRMMRNSVEDKYKLMMAGVNPKIMLKAGIDPSFLLAGGVGGLKEDILRSIGVTNIKLITTEQIKRIGYNPSKLTSKGIDAKKLVLEGIEAYPEKVIKAQMGIDSEKLMSSITNGLEPKRLMKGGIDVKRLISMGVDPKLLLVGGLRSAVKNDTSKISLAKIGIDLDMILSMGININLLLDIGAAVLNPINLIKLGIDPQRIMIGTLSRSGLDTLTGGMDDNMSATLGFVSSILQLIKQILVMIPAMRDIPVIGSMIIAKDGRFTGVPGFILYRIIGIDDHGGLLAFSKKLFGGHLTIAEILQLLNPLRVSQAIANPEANINSKFKAKENRKPVDDYMSSPLNMRDESAGND